MVDAILTQLVLGYALICYANLILLLRNNGTSASEENNYYLPPPYMKMTMWSD